MISIIFLEKKIYSEMANLSFYSVKLHVSFHPHQIPLPSRIRGVVPSSLGLRNGSLAYIKTYQEQLCICLCVSLYGSVLGLLGGFLELYS